RPMGWRRSGCGSHRDSPSARSRSPTAKRCWASWENRCWSKVSGRSPRTAAGVHTRGREPRDRSAGGASERRSMLGAGARASPSIVWAPRRSRSLRGVAMTLTADTPPSTTAPAAAPARRSAAARPVFLDALRGFALILMVLNHTGRWWQDRSMGWPWYYSIYVTMAIAAPTFLFLVGFCLPLSLSRTRGHSVQTVLDT